MKLKRIGCTEIAQLIIEHQYYDVKAITFDYEEKKILINGERVEPKLERFKFGMYFTVECTIKDFQDALYGLARLNTPEPVEELHPLCEPIGNWLKENEIFEVRIADIVLMCLKGTLLDLTHRQIEMTVAKCLKQLGWKKIKKENGNVWIPTGYLVDRGIQA